MGYKKNIPSQNIKKEIKFQLKLSLFGNTIYYLDICL